MVSPTGHTYFCLLTQLCVNGYSQTANILLLDVKLLFKYEHTKKKTNERKKAIRLAQKKILSSIQENGFVENRL